MAIHCANKVAVLSRGSSGRVSSLGAMRIASTVSSATIITATITGRLQKSGSHGGL